MKLDILDSNIKKAKNILIASHINPDGDTLGCMCGLYSIIWNNYKKKCDMVAVSQIPGIYKFLPNINLVKNIDDLDKSRVYDLIINVDIASVDRCEAVQILFDKAKFTINIDHHKTNDNYAMLNIVDENSAACAQLLAKLAFDLNWKLDKDSAICLYAGIMTDTGCFKYSNTTSETFEIAGKLMGYGISPHAIAQKCYDSNPKNLVLFQSYVISKTVFENNDTIAYTIVLKKDLEKFNYNGDDFTEGLVEKLRAINTVDVAFIVKEISTSLTKISMRSKRTDVAKICSKCGGGGHTFAAGALLKVNIKKAIKLILDEIYNAEEITKI